MGLFYECRELNDKGGSRLIIASAGRNRQFGIDPNSISFSLYFISNGIQKCYFPSQNLLLQFLSLVHLNLPPTFAESVDA